jgi:hypothetical protein
MESMELLTVGEIAGRLRVKKSWVYSHAQEIGGYRLGKYLRFSWPRVIECLDRQCPSISESEDHQRITEFDQEQDKSVD